MKVVLKNKVEKRALWAPFHFGMLRQVQKELCHSRIIWNTIAYPDETLRKLHFQLVILLLLLLLSIDGFILTFPYSLAYVGLRTTSYYYFTLAQGNWTGCFAARSYGLWISHTLLHSFLSMILMWGIRVAFQHQNFTCLQVRVRAVHPHLCHVTVPAFAICTRHFCSSYPNCSAPQALGLQGIVRTPAMCHQICMVGAPGFDLLSSDYAVKRTYHSANATPSVCHNSQVFDTCCLTATFYPIL